MGTKALRVHGQTLPSATESGAEAGDAHMRAPPPAGTGRGSSVFEMVRGWWRRLSLLLQFAVTSSLVLIVGMLVVGNWVTQRISDGVIHSHASSAALYTDSFIEAKVQELATRERLSPQSEADLNTLLLPQATGQPIVGFRIWKGDTVVYSDRPEMIGVTFPPSARRQRAWEGKVSAEYGEPDSGHGPRLNVNQPVLEIYAPVRETGTDRIIALAETYQLAPTLPTELSQARLGSWIVVAGITLLMQLLQFAIVGRGSRTIHLQRTALDQRIEHLSRLLDENRMLRQRSREASRRLAELIDTNLRRVGADLHDGPVQMLGTTILRLDALSGIVSDADKTIVAEAEKEIAELREAVRDALDEIRHLSAGLSPPDITKHALRDALEIAARRHERRTRTTVALDLDDLPDDVAPAIKSSLYRLVQEGLSNAFRHAKGQGQRVTARAVDRQLMVTVEDQGDGFGAIDPFAGHGGQGLIGLRDRIEGIGGEFLIENRPGGGTCLSASFEITPNRGGPQRPHA